MVSDSLTALAEISKGRDFVSTDEAARILNKSPRTLRKLHCLNGSAYGVVPVKLPGSNLLDWPVRSLARVVASATDMALAA